MSINRSMSIKSFIRNNLLKIFITIFMLIIIVLYFSQINWDKFFSNVAFLRMEFFYLSSILGILAFMSDGILWYFFLKPLTKTDISIRYLIFLNFFSVMAGVIVPSGGAVDIAIKMKYVKDNSDLSFEEILASILAVRIIFLITLYPTMMVFVYVLVAFNVVSVEIALFLLLLSFFIISLILLITIIIILNVDFFNRKFIPIFTALLNIFLSKFVIKLFALISVYLLTIMIIYSLMSINIITQGIFFQLTVLFLLFISGFVIMNRIGFLKFSLFENLDFSNKIYNVEKKLLKSSNNFSNSLRLLNGSKRYWYYILGLTIIFWITRFFAMYTIFLVLEDFEFHVIVLTSTIGSFTTMIPAFIPGTAGIREIITTESLNLLSSINNTEVNLLTAIMNQIQNLVLFLFSAIFFSLILRKKRFQTPNKRNI